MSRLLRSSWLKDLSAKIAGEYDTADAIRDRLRNEFGVSVDDRVKEWVVDAQPRGAGASGGAVVDDERWSSWTRLQKSRRGAEEAPAGGQNELVELSALTGACPRGKVGGKKAELVEHDSMRGMRRREEGAAARAGIA